MTETNRFEATLLRRGSPVRTETIFIVVGASVAGVLSLGALLYVLVRCCPKRRRQQAPASGILGESQISPIDIRHSRMDSFVQSPPFIFPETSPAVITSGAQAQEQLADPRFTSADRSSQEITGVAVAWNRQVMSTGHIITTSWPQREDAADTEPPLTSSVAETGTNFPDMSGLKRRSSVPSTDSVYSKASLPISQQSFGLGSTPNATRSASTRPTLQTIPASPYGVYPPRPVPKRIADSRLPQKSILKKTAQPLTPAPISGSPQPSISSAVRSPSYVRPSLPASPYEPRENRASPPSRPRRMDEPPVSPLSSTTEVTSQSDRPSRGHFTPSPIPATPPSAPPSSELSTEPLLNSSLQSPLFPLSSHAGFIRKSRPEPLHLPRESYASVRYARSRAPSDASDTRSSARAHVQVPAAADVHADAAPLGSSSIISGEGQERPTRKRASAFEQARSSPPRPLVRSPTWSMFRGSPGYI